MLEKLLAVKQALENPWKSHLYFLLIPHFHPYFLPFFYSLTNLPCPHIHKRKKSEMKGHCIILETDNNFFLTLKMSDSAWFNVFLI